MSERTEMITRVDFVGVPTHDLPKAVEFYGDTLGLERSVYLQERNYAEFETGNLTLSVIDAEKMGLEHVPVRSGIALHVEDVAAARASARGAAEWSSSATRSTRGCATWRYSTTPMGTC